MILLYIWGAGALILAGTALGLTGYFQTTDPVESGELVDIIGGSTFISLAWPLFAAGLILSLPFWIGKLIATIQMNRKEAKLRAFKSRLDYTRQLRDSFDKTEPEWKVLDNMFMEMSNAGSSK